MRIKVKGDLLEVTTEVFQARNGAVFMNWGNTVIKLSEDDANVVADDVPGIDREAYVNYYKNK